jgi:hypothetical protein
MARIEIADFRITPTAHDKMWAHRIDADQVYAVLDSFWTVTRNRANRAASQILYGTVEQGRCLAIPIVPTEDPLIWRPITAWYCKPREAAILRKARGQ